MNPLRFLFQTEKENLIPHRGVPIANRGEFSIRCWCNETVATHLKTSHLIWICNIGKLMAGNVKFEERKPNSCRRVRDCWIRGLIRYLGINSEARSSRRIRDGLTIVGEVDHARKQ